MSYRGALQQALAAEHAACYVVGVLAGQTSRSAFPGLFASLDAAFSAHRAHRDHLVGAVEAAGADPVAAEPAYVVPADLGTPARVAAVALDVERGCTRSYAWLVENSPPPQRRWAVQVLETTAVRELAFRGAPEMLPGSDEYADR